MRRFKCIYCPYTTTCKMTMRIHYIKKHGKHLEEIWDEIHPMKEGEEKGKS